MDKSIKQNFSKIGLAFLAYIFIWQILSVFVVIIGDIFLLDLIPKSMVRYMSLSYGVLYFVAFPLFLLIMRFVPNCELHPSMNKKLYFHQILPLFLIGMAVTIIIALAFNVFFMLFSDEPYNPIGDMIGELDLVPTLIFTCVIAPIMEEIVFRKVLYKKISAYGSSVYMISSALFFSLFHLNLSQSAYAFFLGLILAWIMYRTGKVIYPILFHFAANLLGGSLGLILMTVFDETVAMMISGMVNILLLLSGIVFAIILIINIVNKKYTFSHAGNLAKPAWSTVFANPGYIIFICITGIFILFSFAIDILSRIDFMNFF